MAPSCSRILRSKVAKPVVSSSRRPAFCCSDRIYGDGLNIRGGIESTGSEHGAELLADIALESCEAGGEQFTAPGFLLLARRETCFARNPFQVQDARLGGIRGVFVIAHADWKIQRDRFKITSGAAHAAHS